MDKIHTTPVYIFSGLWYILGMPNGIKNPRLVDNPWTLPAPTGGVRDDNGPLKRGQQLRVDCNEGFDFIPCFPKPGTERTITRVENGTWVIYLGTVEFNGATCMEFMTEKGKEFFYLGDGALPYLLNIPQKKIRKGHPFRKKSGSAVGHKGGVRHRPSSRKKRLGEGLTNLANGKIRKKKERI